MLRALVSSCETLESCVVLLLFLFVFFVLSFWDLNRIKAVYIPNETNLGPFGFGFGCNILWPSDNATSNRVVCSCEIGSITATFFVRVFDILANIFPGEESLEPRDLCLIMPDKEDKIIRRDRTDTSAGCERCAPSKLGMLALL